MRFDELPLYESVYDVYRTVDNPRSEVWLIEQAKKEELVRRIQQALPMDAPYRSIDMVGVWIAFGKSSNVSESIKKAELIVMVARMHGRRCFYAGRGLGDCSAELQIDRLIPGSRNGPYTVANCVLACSYHNSQRGDKNLEAYLNEAKY